MYKQNFIVQKWKGAEMLIALVVTGPEPLRDI